jgi:hydroxyethylthiazole kinase-like uncharacterized protein yjeF
MKVVTAEQMRRIDRVAIEERGIPGIDLMEAAGGRLAVAVMDHVEPGLVVVLAGGGNNGGDGFVAARHLAQAGYTVVVIPVLGTDNLRGDAALAWERLPRDRVQVRELPGDDAALRDLLADADAIVDAMLGTGARLPLRPPVDAIVRAINASGTPVVAADIPTGLDADGGVQSQDYPIVHAALTVTFGLPKVGMLSARGVAVCGHVRVESINFPRDLLEDESLSRETVTLEEVARLLPPRPASGHKGTFGSVVICGGSRFLPGAAIIASIGAMRSGAGMVRLHAPAPVMVAASCQLPEVMLSAAGAQFDEHLGVICDGSAKHERPASRGERGGGDLTAQRECAYCQTGRETCDFCALLESADALVVGPGIGLHEDTAAFLAQVLPAFDGPIVIDADALKLLASSAELRSMIRPHMVLTPHPGEMARLLGCDIPAVQADRWGAVRHCADEWNATVVLKGYSPLVATPESPVITHIPAGSTALSKGGSGDLLAGLIGGLLAQGLPPRQAVVFATFVGGLASDLLARDRSPRATLIRDVADFLPAAFRQLENAQRAR